jgi:hypothetical protein
VAAARDNHDVSILEEDATTLFTMSTDSSAPSPLNDCPGGDATRESSPLAISMAGPVLGGEDSVDAKEHLELRKVYHSAARRIAAMSNLATKDMDGVGDVDNINKTRRRKVWEVCAVLTSIALLLIAAAVVVTLVHGTRGRRPRPFSSSSSEDENSP